MPRKRANKLESEGRILLAEQLIVRGVPSSQIVSALMQKEAISERQGYRYLEEAMKRMNGEWPFDRTGILIRRSEYLFQQVLADKNHGLANRILQTQMNYQTKIGGKISHAPTSAQSISSGLEAAIRALETKSKTG